MSDLNYTVELTAPDIEPYRVGNTGIEYVTTFEAREPGPHVVVAALTHGSRSAERSRSTACSVPDPAAARRRLGLQRCRGVSRIRSRVTRSRRYVDEDFNRLWHPVTLDGPRQSTELARARVLRPLVDSADFLLDLHSMQYATAPLMLAGLLERSRELARRIGIPELIMCDAGHAAGPRMRDYGGFGDPASTKTALLIECGQHWEHRSAEVATDVTLRFLIAAGSVQAEDVAALGGPDFDAHPRQRVIEVTEAVTITGDRFDFSRDYRGLEVLGQKGSVIGRDGEREVHALR